MNGWKTISSKVVYENPFIRLHEDMAINPAGKETVYGYFESKKASAYVVPVDDEGYTYIVRQYCYPNKIDSWEVPAGGIEPDEDETVGAQRELLEETGFQTAELIKLGKLMSLTRLTTLRSSVFLARQLHKVRDELDRADGISEMKRIPLDDVIDMIMHGEMQCMGSISAYFMAREYLRKE